MTPTEARQLIEEARAEADGFSDSKYEPFDREKWLGVWSNGSWEHPQNIPAWEAAHGHDIRVKCYPEFGCLVVDVPWAKLLVSLAAALSAFLPTDETETVEDEGAKYLRATGSTMPPSGYEDRLSSVTREAQEPTT